MTLTKRSFFVGLAASCLLLALVLSACSQTSTTPAPAPKPTATVASIQTEQPTATPIADPHYCDSLSNSAKPIFDLFVNNVGSSNKLVLDISLDANHLLYYGGHQVHATSKDWLGDNKLNDSGADYMTYISNFPEQTQHVTYHFHVEVTNGFIAVVEDPGGDSYHPMMYLMGWSQLHGIYLYNFAVGSNFDQRPSCLYPNGVLVP